MINYRLGKKCYKVNSLGSLYIDESKLSINEQPIIYIGGQMEHRGHVLEQSGYTGDLSHNIYTGSWMYDYSIFSKNKNAINAQNFSENLLECIREAKLHEVILVTHSHGGLIAAYATKSEDIDRAISVHPPIFGTPLADPKALTEYEILFTKKQKVILTLLKAFINREYGFEKDNYKGMDLSAVDLNKLLVAGNYIDENSERNKILVETYRMIQSVTGCRSDGVVTFEPSQFEQLGINYFQTDKNANHFESSNSEYIEEIVKRVLTK